MFRRNKIWTITVFTHRQPLGPKCVFIGFHCYLSLPTTIAGYLPRSDQFGTVKLPEVSIHSFITESRSLPSVIKEQPNQDARPFVGSLIMLSRSAGGDLTGTNHATTTLSSNTAVRAQAVVARAPTRTTIQINQCARRCQTTVKR